MARWTLAGLSMCMLLAALGTSIANVGLPMLDQAFGASFAQVQWIVLAYLLASTTLVVSVGRLGDIAGRRRLLLAGIALFTLASALCGAASTLWLLIAARALQGVGAAIMFALSMALISEAVPKARAGSAHRYLARPVTRRPADFWPRLAGDLPDQPSTWLARLPARVSIPAG